MLQFKDPHNVAADWTLIHGMLLLTSFGAWLKLVDAIHLYWSVIFIPVYIICIKCVTQAVHFFLDKSAQSKTPYGTFIAFGTLCVAAGYVASTIIGVLVLEDVLDTYILWVTLTCASGLLFFVIMLPISNLILSSLHMGTRSFVRELFYPDSNKLGSAAPHSTQNNEMVRNRPISMNMMNKNNKDQVLLIEYPQRDMDRNEEEEIFEVNGIMQ